MSSSRRPQWMLYRSHSVTALLYKPTSALAAAAAAAVTCFKWSDLRLMLTINDCIPFPTSRPSVPCSHGNVTSVQQQQQQQQQRWENVKQYRAWQWQWQIAQCSTEITPGLYTHSLSQTITLYTLSLTLHKLHSGTATSHVHPSWVHNLQTVSCSRAAFSA